MRINLKVWRQAGPDKPGRLVDYVANDVLPDMSFLEMLDVVNETLIVKGEDPIAFDSDCREGICGACGFLVGGIPHGPDPGTTVCQLHMRRFNDGDTLTLEPWRAKAFPVIKGSRRRPQRVRSHYSGWWLHLGQRRRRPRRQFDLDPQASGR
jgi:succinate dehydrogenase / fumarate reductase iron-sulfur subunit